MNIPLPYPFPTHAMLRPFKLNPIIVSPDRTLDIPSHINALDVVKELQDRLKERTIAYMDRDQAQDRKIKELESRLAKYETP